MQVNILFIKNNEPLQILVLVDQKRRINFPTINIEEENEEKLINEFLDKFNFSLNEKKLKLLEKDNDSILIGYELNNKECKKLESELFTNVNVINLGLSLDVLYCTSSILSSLKNREINLSNKFIDYLSTISVNKLEKGESMKINKKKATLNDYDVEKIKEFFSSVITENKYNKISEGGKIGYRDYSGQDIDPLKSSNFKIGINKLNESINKSFNYDFINEDLDKISPLKRKQFILLTGAYISINSGFVELTLEKNQVLGKIGELFPDTYVKICEQQQNLIKTNKNRPM